MRGRIFYIAFISIAVFFIARQYGGWNLDADLTVWRERMARLQPEADEPRILDAFRRVQPLNRSYTIGVVAVTDHHPVFGGEDYRVYDIGYYDADKRMRHLAHVTCVDGRIRKIDVQRMDE